LRHAGGPPPLRCQRRHPFPRSTPPPPRKRDSTCPHVCSRPRSRPACTVSMRRRARPRPAHCTSLLDPPRASFSPKSLVQKLARPLRSTCTRRCLRKNMLKHAYVCMTAFFNHFLDASEASLRAASHGLERHGENARVQTCAQQVRASAPILSTRFFRFSCTLH